MTELGTIGLVLMLAGVGLVITSGLWDVASAVREVARELKASRLKAD